MPHIPSNAREFTGHADLPKIRGPLSRILWDLYWVSGNYHVYGSNSVAAEHI